MTGNAVGLTERDRAVLSEVLRFGVVSRQQLTALGHFHSKTRANERLRRLTAAGYLSATRLALPAGGPSLVYTAGPKVEASRTPRRRIAEGSDLSSSISSAAWWRSASRSNARRASRAG